MITDDDLHMNNRTLIHVYGTERSGSTMLDLMLGNSPDAFSCGEVSAWFRPYRGHHRKIECSCQDNPCLVWNKIKNVSERDFHAQVFREFDVSFVIDSSKDICWLLDAQSWAKIHNIRTINLLLWKNPIDLAYSYWKRGKDIAYWRSNFVKTYRWVFEVGLPFISVNFNTLAANPKDILVKMCLATGMPYFDGKERFWDKSHHYLFGSGGVRKQMEADSSMIKYEQVFPGEFKISWNRYCEDMAEDVEIQDIIDILNSRNIATHDNRSNKNAMNAKEEFEGRNLLPAWYYRKKLIRLVRRYIPEKYESEQYYDVEYNP